ncbi:MAG: hypothetical protein P1Q69_12325 [Candidatus Thorarchaeota archaeon]|nr:hypothetical protein [Candidatus Thorarchaeota archaeon]
MSIMDMTGRVFPVTLDIMDSAWIAGALAALEIPLPREPEEIWAPFIEDIFNLSELVCDVESVRPGQSPVTGSVLDSLGGYISLAGRVTNQGIHFPVDSDSVLPVNDNLPGIKTQFLGGIMVIPPSQICKLLSLVPLRGPIEEQAMEVAA